MPETSLPGAATARAAELRDIPLSCAEVAVEGAVSVQESAGGSVQPWRLDGAARELVHPALLGPAKCGAGVRLRLRTDASELVLRLVPSDDPPRLKPPRHGLCDLVIDGVRSATAVVPASGEVAFTGLPPGAKEIAAWLPPEPAYLVAGLRISHQASLFPVDPDRRPSWLVYGSSITQGVGLSPTRSWAVTAAGQLGRRIYCLGFDGGCHLDPPVATMIGALAPDYICLEIGINVYLSQSFSSRTFGPAIHGFADLIRRALPATPVTVVTPVTCPRHEGDTGPGRLSLAEIRTTIRQVVAVRQARGDRRLAVVDGQALLPEPDLLPDGLHPSLAGHRLLAQRYAAWERAGELS